MTCLACNVESELFLFCRGPRRAMKGCLILGSYDFPSIVLWMQLDSMSGFGKKKHRIIPFVKFDSFFFLAS